MSRIQQHLSCSFYYVFRACIFIAVIALSFLFSPSAYADPHAVFYTDRAQEQLFYNTLAALNQADFVEPALGQFGRDNLINQRSQALPGPAEQFTKENNPIITSTHSDLPAILTRSITLEGNDLWTAYLVNQFALETASRRSESELARIFCERGLGRIGCSQTPGKAQQQDEAFITQPVTQQGFIAAAVDAILSSGKAVEKTLRTQITSNIEDKPVYEIPRPNSPSLASLHENVQNNNAASQIIDSITESISVGAEVDPDTFEGITADKDGVLSPPDDISAPEYIRKLAQLTNLSSNLTAIAQDGKRQALAFQSYTQTPNVNADYVLEREAGSQNGSGAVIGRITVPASAKIAQVNAGAQLLADIATSQKYTNPNSITQSGNQSLIDSNQPTTTRTPLPNVPINPNPAQPINPSNNQQPQLSQNQQGQSPQVAGTSTSSNFDAALNQVFQENYNDPQAKNLSPTVRDESILKEPGIEDLIQAITGDAYRRPDASSSVSQSAFSIDLNGLLNSAQSTMSAILCSIFPSIESCIQAASNNPTTP